MSTTCLPTIRAWVATRCQHWWGRVLSWTYFNRPPVGLGWGPMSRKGGAGQFLYSEGSWGSCGLRSYVQSGALYGEVQCIIGNDHIGHPPVDRMTELQTDTTKTRMHSTRMRTAHSLTISCHILCMPPWQPCMPPATMHAPLATMHAPWQPCMPPGNHTHPQQPHMPLVTMQAPWQSCMPPSNHAHPLATMHAP